MVYLQRLAVFFLLLANSCGCWVQKWSFCSMQRWEGGCWDLSAVEQFSLRMWGTLSAPQRVWNVSLMNWEKSCQGEGGRRKPPLTQNHAWLLFVSVLTWVTFFCCLLWNRLTLKPLFVFLCSVKRSLDLGMESRAYRPCSLSECCWLSYLTFSQWNGTHTPLLPLSLLWMTRSCALGILFCMKKYGKETHLLSIWKIYIIIFLIVKRWGETTHGAGRGCIMACVWRSDEGFVESVISFLYRVLGLKSGHQADSTSHWHFHFYISWVNDLEVSCIVLIWTHSPCCPHFPPDSLVNDLLHFHSVIVPCLQLILQTLVHTLSWWFFLSGVLVGNWS